MWRQSSNLTLSPVIRERSSISTQSTHQLGHRADAAHIRASCKSGTGLGGASCGVCVWHVVHAAIGSMRANAQPWGECTCASMFAATGPTTERVAYMSSCCGQHMSTATRHRAAEMTSEPRHSRVHGVRRFVRVVVVGRVALEVSPQIRTAIIIQTRVLRVIVHHGYIYGTPCVATSRCRYHGMSECSAPSKPSVMLRQRLFQFRNQFRNL